MLLPTRRVALLHTPVLDARRAQREARGRDASYEARERRARAARRLPRPTEPRALRAETRRGHDALMRGALAAGDDARTFQLDFFSLIGREPTYLFSISRMAAVMSHGSLNETKP